MRHTKQINSVVIRTSVFLSLLLSTNLLVAATWNAGCNTVNNSAGSVTQCCSAPTDSCPAFDTGSTEGTQSLGAWKTHTYAINCGAEVAVPNQATTLTGVDLAVTGSDNPTVYSPSLGQAPYTTVTITNNTGDEHHVTLNSATCRVN